MRVQTGCGRVGRLGAVKCGKLTTERRAVERRFFLSSRRRHTRYWRDWSSDVCSSDLAEGRFGRVLEVRSLFLHSSDLDPEKPINWKRRAETNGAYGCLGDLGMHALHLPLRAGWAPLDVRAVLADVFKERPDGRGGRVPCDTPDNAVLLCRAEHAGDEFPLRI